MRLRKISNISRSRKFGFITRSRESNNILISRRRKGRKRLTPVYSRSK